MWLPLAFMLIGEFVRLRCVTVLMTEKLCYLCSYADVSLEIWKSSSGIIHVSIVITSISTRTSLITFY